MKTLLLLLLFLWNFSFAQHTIIGKFERVSLLEFGLKELRAKTDTGAKTSSIHCSVIMPLPKNRVAFVLLDGEHKKFQPKMHTATISRVSKVKSSNGKVQVRYFIKTDISLLGKTYHTEFSLSNRGSMRFPILLGRSLLKEGFLVDVTKKYSQQ
jgi:hypothetical protein